MKKGLEFWNNYEQCAAVFLITFGRSNDADDHGYIGIICISNGN